MDSFPELEQRTKSKAIKLLVNSDLCLYSYCINDELLAGVWFWEFISVSNNFRNGGYGSLMIDDISIRRYGFYNRNGFEYITPAYNFLII